MSSDDPQLIAPRVDACVARFDELCRLLPESDQGTRSTLFDQLGRFRIWAGNIGAFQHLPLPSSLDNRLREAPKVATQVVELLDDLEETLLEVHSIVSGNNPNRVGFSTETRVETPLSANGEVETAINSSDQSEPLSELEELLQSSADTITGLFKISVLIRNATTRDRYAKAAKAQGEPFDAQFDISHVGHKFPRIHQTEWLEKRLGKAITQRRQYLRYCRQHRDRLEIQNKSKDCVETMEVNGRRNLAPLEQIQHSGDMTESPTQNAKPPSTLAITTASTLMSNSLEKLDEVSDEAQSQTSYATSMTDDENNDTLRVPQLPGEAARGLPFECPYCRVPQLLKHRRAWKKHIFQDLKAYVCTFGECDLKMFTDRSTWFNHELQVHRVEWYCPFCSHAPLQNLGSFESHLQGRHAQTFTIAQLQALAKTCQQSVNKISPEDCPFCEEWAAKLKDINPHLSEDVLVVTVDQFKKHVGFHMEQLALFALPRDHGDDVGSTGAAADHGKRPDSDFGCRAPYEEQDNPPLHVAAYEGLEEEVKRLLEGGADVNAPGQTWGNVLQAAVLGGNFYVVQLLLKYSANASLHGGYYGQNPYRTALQSNRPDLAQLLENRQVALPTRGDHDMSVEEPQNFSDRRGISKYRDLTDVSDTAILEGRRVSKDFVIRDQEGKVIGKLNLKSNFESCADRNPNSYGAIHDQQGEVVGYAEVVHGKAAENAKIAFKSANENGLPFDPAANPELVLALKLSAEEEKKRWDFEQERKDLQRIREERQIGNLASSIHELEETGRSGIERSEGSSIPQTYEEDDVPIKGPYSVDGSSGDDEDSDGIEEVAERTIREIDEATQASLPNGDVSILVGKKINAMGIILDDRGEPIGKIVGNSDLEACAGRTVSSATGSGGTIIRNEVGDIIGFAEIVPGRATDKATRERYQRLHEKLKDTAGGNEHKEGAVAVPNPGLVGNHIVDDENESEADSGVIATKIFESSVDPDEDSGLYHAMKASIEKEVRGENIDDNAFYSSEEDSERGEGLTERRSISPPNPRQGERSEEEGFPDLQLELSAIQRLITVTEQFIDFSEKFMEKLQAFKRLVFVPTFQDIRRWLPAIIEILTDTQTRAEEGTYTVTFAESVYPLLQGLELSLEKLDEIVEKAEPPFELVPLREKIELIGTSLENAYSTLMRHPNADRPDLMKQLISIESKLVEGASDQETNTITARSAANPLETTHEACDGQEATLDQSLEKQDADFPTTARVGSQIRDPQSKWLYLDIVGKIRGPFSGHQMCYWYSAGLLPRRIRVRKVGDTEYVPLFDVIEQLSEGLLSPEFFTEMPPGLVNVANSSDSSLQWPLDRVLSWLAANGFSNDWQATFKALDLYGEEFLNLDLGNGSKDDSAMMGQVIYARLERECHRNGTVWDQMKEREEGRRLRRLIREIALDLDREEKSPSQGSDLPEHQQQLDTRRRIRCTVISNFTAQTEDQLTVAADDQVLVMVDTTNQAWWTVKRVDDGREGKVPGSCVMFMPSDELSVSATSTVEPNKRGIGLEVKSGPLQDIFEEGSGSTDKRGLQQKAEELNIDESANRLKHSGNIPAAAPSYDFQSFGSDSPEGYRYRYSDCSGRRKALLIGINSLIVKNTLAYLCSEYYYDEGNIVVLSTQPTKRNILSAMAWLVKGAQTNDCLFLHYSGPAGKISRLENDYKPINDVVIYPVDFKIAGHIASSEMYSILVQPLKAGVRLTAIFEDYYDESPLKLPYIYSAQAPLKGADFSTKATQRVLNKFSSNARRILRAMSTTGPFEAPKEPESNILELAKVTKTSPADVLVFHSARHPDLDPADTGTSTAFIFFMAHRYHRTASYAKLLSEMEALVPFNSTIKPRISCCHPLNMHALFVM